MVNVPGAIQTIGSITLPDKPTFNGLPTTDAACVPPLFTDEQPHTPQTIRLNHTHLKQSKKHLIIQNLNAAVIIIASAFVNIPLCFGGSLVWSGPLS